MKAAFAILIVVFAVAFHSALADVPTRRQPQNAMVSGLLAEMTLYQRQGKTSQGGFRVGGLVHSVSPEGLYLRSVAVIIWDADTVLVGGQTRKISKPGPVMYKDVWAFVKGATGKVGQRWSADVDLGGGMGGAIVIDGTKRSVIQCQVPVSRPVRNR